MVKGELMMFKLELYPWTKAWKPDIWGEKSVPPVAAVPDNTILYYSYEI